MQKDHKQRIGIDARLLAYPLTGIGRYTHEMTKALLRADADVTLYMPADPVHALDHEKGRLEVKASRLFGRAGRFVWGQGVLPFIARWDAPDVYWGPTHRLPPFLPYRTRAFVTIHDLVWKHAGETMRPTSRLLEQTLMPKAIRRADGVIAVSEYTRRDVLNAFPQIDCPVRTIYPGIAERPPEYDLSYLLKWAIDQPYILFVGTLEPRKNLGRLLGAYARLSEQERHLARLVIAGGAGWGDLNLVQMIQSLGLDKHVHLTGYVDERELSTLYKNALFLAMPSLYEGFGLPLIEAMSYGVPSLTSNISSIPEVAGDTGLLVDPLDVDAIASGLRDLLSWPAHRQALGLRARERTKLFQWDIAARKLLKFFQDGF